MFDTLPMTALRTFEASARLQSFKAAADELAVTPTAVSHQIKTLESWLGVPLFERLPRKVRLTECGERLFKSTHTALLDIAQTVAQLRPQPSTGQLTVSTTPAFAALWLIPRLGRFYASHPEINLRLDTRCEVIDLHRDASVDLVVRYGSGDNPGLHSQRLLQERFGVYGAPALLQHAAGHRPSTLLSVCWGGSVLYRQAWMAWCDAAGVDWLAHVRLRDYDEESYALQAAIAGQGLAMLSSLLVSDSVAAGLLQPYRPEISVPGAGYNALCVPGRERHLPVRAFLDWLSTEVDAEAPRSAEGRSSLRS
ncbi:LysR substrate-binding domain-containing protein [Aquabacterium sp. A7-Y]|uniref:LysR substrate-binding domain-containing protein n=1 Tax=Aquabacterium sp. A7-Y TaxID=1349605 RepID=UPI00223D1C5C|nr:LysR substrate-binding domain-containing protein [Aquabacterium sp. A7-Y]MCW7540975.1 LysR substrate-binding domain-containing protein [Aquabacterium sp. A7-Y]